MYCKKCGKLIDDDAQFCKYCGENVGTVLMPSSKRSLTNWFQSKSRGFRLCFILGLFWFFIAFCLLFVCEYSEDYQMLFAVSFGVPLLAWSIWYYRKYLKKDRKVKTAPQVLQKQQDSAFSASSMTCSEIPLQEFAKEYGNMQVVKIADGSTGDISVRCLFTKKTFVDFSKEVGVLSANEIAEKKDGLYVKAIGDNQYELVSK